MKPSVFLRFIAFILIVTVSVTLVPTGVIFAEDVSYEYPFFSEEQYPVSDYSFDDTEITSDSSADALYEEENLRTYNSKTLRLSDGTHTVGTYGFSVHFETSEGFAEYDNTLKLCEGKYIPTASDSGLSFDEYKPSYSMRIGGKDVTFTLINDGQNYISAQTDTYSFGLVSGVKEKEDYSRSFYDVGAGAVYGVDYCWFRKVNAFSFTIGSSYGAYIGYDYYWCFD